MKLSRKFLEEYVDIEPSLTINDIANDMTNVGNEYDSAMPLINATKLVIGEVISCQNHPDSDHLHLCKVNIGSEILDIICGAPNVREGLKVITALDGATLPGGTIKKSTIRGYTSNGMLCSLAELGLDHKFLKEEDMEEIGKIIASTVTISDKENNEEALNNLRARSQKICDKYPLYKNIQGVLSAGSSF